LPELPDILLYQSRLRERIVGQQLREFRVFNPFVLRSVQPPIREFADRAIVDIGRLGKRLVVEFEDEYFAVIHLMIAGRLNWQAPAPPPKVKLGKVVLASWVFDPGELTLVEFSTKKRASINLVKGRTTLEDMRRKGLDVFASSEPDLANRFKEQNRTLKKILTDPDLFDGIGNAYSDEILFRAKLSPIKLSKSLTEAEVERLIQAMRGTMSEWTAKLASDFPKFPKPAQITAFRPDFAVHGRYGLPCPVCQSPIQRIVRGEHETNYCATCQTWGRLLADHSLSRLLKGDWPESLEEMLSA
jgi:formamidopyrimidine-DNA glycosylase